MQNKIDIKGLHEIVLDTGVGHTGRKLLADEARLRYDGVRKNYSFTFNTDISAIIKERGYDTFMLQYNEYLEDVYLFVGKKFRLNLRYTGKGQSNVMFAYKSYIAWLYAALFNVNVINGQYISLGLIKPQSNIDFLGFLETYQYHQAGGSVISPAPHVEAIQPGVYSEKISIGDNLSKNTQAMIFKLG